MATPQRTCVGCRGVDDRTALLRLVWDPDRGAVVLDPTATRPGRGVWVHDRESCVDTACRRRAIGRGLRRTDVDHEQIRRDPGFGFNNGAETR
ncbi:MAG: YlxR family protein [Propionibacterium sp.]|nr:YlxR family protein [Propionibacterium sp.]